MNESNSSQFSEEADISLLDILLVIAANLRLLVLGPLLAGVLAYGAVFVWPARYESVAVQMGDMQLVAMMNSARVLDAVAAESPFLHGDDADELREHLRSDIKVSFSPKDRTVTVRATAGTPAHAQQLVASVLKYSADLNKSRVEEIAAIKQLVRKDGTSLTATADLLRLMDVSFEVIQEPTLPTRRAGQKPWLVALFGALLVEFVLLGFVFVRHSVAVAAAHDSISFEKLRTLKILLLKAFCFYHGGH